MGGISRPNVDVRPTIPLGRQFWALSKNEHEEIIELFGSKKTKSLVAALRPEARKRKV
jgi:hypothetical protein